MTRVRQLGLPVIPPTPSRSVHRLIAEEYPEWYTPSKYRKGGNSHVLRGHHPFGYTLGAVDTRCRDCTKRRPVGAGKKTFSKCARDGYGRDLMQKWRGCDEFECAFPTNVDHPFPVGDDAFTLEYTERLTLTQWLMVFETDCRQLAGLPQDAAVEVAIDKLLSDGAYVQWLNVWQHARGLTDS